MLTSSWTAHTCRRQLGFLDSEVWQPPSLSLLTPGCLRADFLQVAAQIGVDFVWAKSLNFIKTCSCNPSSVWAAPCQGSGQAAWSVGPASWSARRNQFTNIFIYIVLYLNSISHASGVQYRSSICSCVLGYAQFMIIMWFKTSKLHFNENVLYIMWIIIQNLSLF